MVGSLLLIRGFFCVNASKAKKLKSSRCGSPGRTASQGFPDESFFSIKIGLPQGMHEPV